MIVESANVFPSIICLLFTLMLCFKHNKSRKLTALQLLLGTLTLFYFTCSIYAKPIHNLTHFMIQDSISEGISIIVPGIMLVYLRLLDPQPKSNNRILMYLVISVGIFMTLASLLFYGIMGAENAEKFILAANQTTGFPEEYKGERLYEAYTLINFGLYYVIITIEILLLAGHIAVSMLHANLKYNHLIGFFKQKNSSKILAIQSFLILLVTILGAVRMILSIKDYAFDEDQNLVIAVAILSVLNGIFAFFLGYVGFWSDYEEVSLTALLNPFAQIQPKMPTMGEELEMSEQSYQILKAKFDEMMHNDKAFLDPDLSIDSLSKKLESNRTYISKIVNVQYKTDFRNYINILRINHAKSLISEDPDASMEYIALKSGFKTLSQFSRKFKEIDGDTPRHWEKYNVRH